MERIVKYQRKEDSTQNVLDSREVAQMLEKDHKYILRDIEGTEKVIGIIPTLLSANLHPEEYFIEDTYCDKSGKYNKCYQVTKMGCEMLGNKQQGEKGILFTAKYVKRFNEMEHGLIQQPLMSMEDIMIKSLEQMKDIKQQLNEVNSNALQANYTAVEAKNEVQCLKDTATLSPAQCDMVVDRYKAKIVYLLGGKDSAAYKDNSLRGQVFSDFHKSIKEEFGVKYKHIFVKNLNELIQFIDQWRPQAYLIKSIQGFNGQLSMF